MSDTNNTDAVLRHRAGTPYEGCACWFRDDLFEEVARDCPQHGTDAINRVLVDHVNNTLDMVQAIVNNPARCEACGGPGNLHWGDCTKKDNR